MADRRHRGPRPSKADAAMLGRIQALEARVLKLEENSEKAAVAVLEALARLPGARGSMPPPKT